MTFDLSGDTLDMVWGSPNNGSEGSPAYGDDNYVSFYNGANPIGTIEAGDLYADFTGVCNCQSPGYLLSIVLPKGQTYTSVVFGTSPSDFEFAITQSVPEPSTWAMMLAGFAGLGWAGYRKSQASASGPRALAERMPARASRPQAFADSVDARGRAVDDSAASAQGCQGQALSHLDRPVCRRGHNGTFRI